MKMHLRLGFSIPLLAAWSVAAVHGSDIPYRMTLSSNSVLRLEGDSTLHPYESAAHVLQLESQVLFGEGTTNLTVADFLKNPDRAPRIPRLVLSIPIREMKSKTLGLDPNLHKALKYRDYPAIVFDMTSYRVEKSKQDADGFTVAADGNLSLAGKTNRVTVAMTAALAGGGLNVRGQHEMLMSDYGVPPPSLFFGTITVVDKIVVKWNLHLSLTPTPRLGRSEPMR